MSISIITPPDLEATPPISVDLLKVHLSILPIETDFDSLLDLYLGSAVEEFEAYTKRAILNQTVRQSFDQFPCENYFRLERAPLVSFTSLTYKNRSGAWITVDPTIYSYDIIESAPMIQLNYGKYWPTDIACAKNSVRLNYVVGYGEDQAAIPKDIKRILCMMVGDSHLNREDSMVQPGAGKVVVNNSSIAAMKKWMLNYFEHPSQRLKQW